MDTGENRRLAFLMASHPLAFSTEPFPGSKSKYKGVTGSVSNGLQPLLPPPSPSPSSATAPHSTSHVDGKSRRPQHPPHSHFCFCRTILDKPPCARRVGHHHHMCRASIFWSATARPRASTKLWVIVLHCLGFLHRRGSHEKFSAYIGRHAKLFFLTTLFFGYVAEKKNRVGKCRFACA
jgi:hypothetical protein